MSKDPITSMAMAAKNAAEQVTLRQATTTQKLVVAITVLDCAVAQSELLTMESIKRNKSAYTREDAEAFNRMHLEYADIRASLTEVLELIEESST